MVLSIKSANRLISVENISTQFLKFEFDHNCKKKLMKQSSGKLIYKFYFNSAYLIIKKLNVIYIYIYISKKGALL